MAIESTQVTDILSKEGDISAKAEELLALFNKDTEEQLTSIKMNKEQILEEKRESEAKRKTLQEQLADMQAKNEELNKQLAAASPEEVKKIYDQKVTEMANIHEKRVAEIQGVLDSYKAQNSELKRAQLKLECMKEFNEAVKGKNIASDSLTDFADYVLGVDCSKFEKRPVGDGKEILATKDGVTIEGAVKAGLLTSFGKHCVINTSTGGGAEGSSYTGVLTNNPFKTKNYTEIGRLFREDRELYEKMKAQAGS